MPYVVERKPLTLSERLYLPQILAGMRVTLRRLFAPNVTMEYPEQRPAIPTGYRGVPTLVKDPHGREKCVSCQLCEFVCPPKAIRITPGSVEDQPDRTHVEKGPQAFDIDMLRCIYCGFCVDACPKDAIRMDTGIYEINAMNRQDMIHNKIYMVDLMDGEKPEAGQFYRENPDKAPAGYRQDEPTVL